MNKHLNIILTVLIGFAVFTSSCGDEEEPDLIPDNYYGEVTALKNGVEWHANPYGVAYREDSLFSLLFDQLTLQAFVRERLSFVLVKENSSQQKLAPSSNFYGEGHRPIDSMVRSDSAGISFMTIVGGDAIGDIYDIIPEPSNYITITSYDEETNEIEGEFEATLFMTKGSEFTIGSPDTIRFTQGVFRTKVRDE